MKWKVAFEQNYAITNEILPVLKFAGIVYLISAVLQCATSYELVSVAEFVSSYLNL